VSFCLPFLHGLRPNHHYLYRLLVIFLTFSPVFIILTISYEGLFYFVFCAILFTWVRLEHRIHIHTPPASSSTLLSSILTATDANIDSATQSSISSLNPAKDPYRPLSLSDFRAAIFFFFLVQSAFFSTGNIASISSFSLDSVYRLIPVFNPFSQGALLVLKLLIPFALISANLGILTRRLGVPPSSLFMLVTAFSDVLTMNFFWMVRDEGSWLDIGSSISHFCIASLLCVFVACLELLSEVFVSGVTVDREGSGEDEQKVKEGAGRKETANGDLDKGKG
jgi:phosphatidylinositol glycan class N